MGYADGGKIDWEILEYENCEEKGYFAGIRIGKRKIYLVSPQEKPVRFVVTDLRDSKLKELTENEFNIIIRNVFDENEAYYIDKCVWRTSS